MPPLMVVVDGRGRGRGRDRMVGENGSEVRDKA